MDKSIIELLSEVSGADLLFAILLIISLGVVFFSQKDKITKHLNKWRKTKNDEEDFTKLVYDMKDTIGGLKETMSEYQINREHDRDDSRKIREEMYEVMNKQSKAIEDLTKMIVKMKEQNSKTKRAEIKEKIERIYRECHPSMTCTDMAFETLRDLIEEYEEHGGDNSFVHSTVVPEMYTWKKIESIRRVGSDEKTNNK